MADNRSIVYTESGSYPGQDRTIYRASSFGHCLRQLVLAHRGYDTMPWPPGILAAFDAGNAAERTLIDYMRRPEQTKVIGWNKNDEPDKWQILDDPLTYWSIYAEQREYDLELLPNRFIRVHIDALGKKFNTRDDGQLASLDFGHYGQIVIEFKAFGPTLMKKFLGSGLNNGLQDLPAYEMQLSIEMIATKSPGLFVILDKEATEIKGEPVVHWKLYTEPPIGRGQMVARLLQIEKHLRDNTLPDCGDNVNHGFCPYYKYHDGPDTTGYGEVDSQIAALLGRYETLGDDIRLLQAERDDLRGTLREAIGVDAPKRVGDRVFGFYTSTRDKWDAVAMKEFIELEHPQIDVDQFRSQTEIVTARFSDA